jgi:hemoglobin
MHDIESLTDCRTLVERFYATAAQDPLLGPIFTARLSRSWPAHMETMTRFWGAVLFAQPLYHGRPLERHEGLPLEEAHFSRWLSLWTDAVDALFAGPRADHAKRGAARMAVRIAGALAAPPSGLVSLGRR